MRNGGIYIHFFVLRTLCEIFESIYARRCGAAQYQIMADNDDVTKSVSQSVFDKEIRRLQNKIIELEKNQILVDRRQRRLRAFVWGTDKGSYYDENGKGGINVEPLDAQLLEDYGSNFTLIPDQPSVTDRFHQVERLTRENKAFAMKELDPTLQALRQMSKENKVRSKKNEKEMDKSLEKRAKRFFGFGKKRKLHDELRF